MNTAGENTGGEVDSSTPVSQVIFAVRDEADKLWIKIPYDTLVIGVGGNAELYKRALEGGYAFSGEHLVPPNILRAREKIRNEFSWLGEYDFTAYAK